MSLFIQRVSHYKVIIINLFVVPTSTWNHVSTKPKFLVWYRGWIWEKSIFIFNLVQEIKFSGRADGGELSKTHSSSVWNCCNNCKVAFVILFRIKDPSSAGYFEASFDLNSTLEYFKRLRRFPLKMLTKKYQPMFKFGPITATNLVVAWLGLWWSWRLFWWSLFLLKYKFWAGAIYNHFMVFDTDFKFSRIILIGINQFAQWFYFETQLK